MGLQNRLGRLALTAVTAVILLQTKPISAETAPAVEDTLRAPKHAIAMHGEPKLPADLANLPYANPDARQGGRIAYGFVGTFDSLNPFIVKGVAT